MAAKLDFHGWRWYKMAGSLVERANNKKEILCSHR